MAGCHPLAGMIHRAPSDEPAHGHSLLTFITRPLGPFGLARLRCPWGGNREPKPNSSEESQDRYERRTLSAPARQASLRTTSAILRVNIRG
jgi:hypothetical protein